MAETVCCESWVKDRCICESDLSVVLGQELTNVAGVGIDGGRFDEDAIDGVPQGKVLGVKG